MKDILCRLTESQEWLVRDGFITSARNASDAADEIKKLRAENASLKEVISLSEDSRLMDEYLKLERANTRQAERIKEQAAEIKRLKSGRVSNVKFRQQIEKLAAILTQAEKSVIDIVQPDNSVAEVKMSWAAWALLRAQAIIVIEAKCDLDGQECDNALAAIAELEKGVG